MLLDKVRREKVCKQPRVGLTYIVAGRGEFGGSAHVVIMLPERRKRGKEGEDSVRERRGGRERKEISNLQRLSTRKKRRQTLCLLVPQAPLVIDA